MLTELVLNHAWLALKALKRGQSDVGGRTEERNAGEWDSCGGGEQIQLFVVQLSTSSHFFIQSFTFSEWENETLRLTNLLLTSLFFLYEGVGEGRALLTLPTMT